MTRREPTDDELLAMLEGELTSSRAGTIDTHIHSCASCRARLRRLSDTLDAVGTVETESASIDLVRSINERIDHPEPNRPKQARAWVWALAVAVAGLGLLLPLAQQEEIRSKAGAARPSERWTGIRVFRLGEEGPSPVSDLVRPDDDLLFAYANLGDHPAEHLMIFGVDRSGRVYWYYPAHRDPTLDPGSIPIQPASSRELREKIRHPLEPGHLTLHALFTNEPLLVSEVEEAVAEGHLQDLAADGTLQTLHLEVAP